MKDNEADPDIDVGLKEGLVETLKNEHGFELIDDPNQADYACYVYIRYFNTNTSKPKPGDRILENEPLAGGQQGWKDLKGRVIDRPPPQEEIPRLGNSNLWDLMIDLAVGEKIEPEGAEPYAQLRSGRLLGRVRGSREDALWQFREGRPPPGASTGPDGTLQPRPQPGATQLVNVLSKGLFRASGDLPDGYEGPVSRGGPRYFDWRPKQTSFKTDPAAGDTFFLAVEDFEEDEELYKGVREGLIWSFEQKGLKLVQEPKDARYACYVSIRYFNGVPKDGGQALKEAAGDDIFGGRKGWKIEGSDDLLGEPRFVEIPPMKNVEGWGLLIDIAVGEKVDEDVILRTGRLFASIPGADREDALWLFRKGERPPEEPEVAKGQPHPRPARPDPPSHLVQTLSETVLPVRGGL